MAPTNKLEAGSSPGAPGATELGVILVLLLIALGLSAVDPHERLTWWLEVAPVLLGMTLVGATHRRFPLSTLLVRLLFLHALILRLGGHYTYARVPLGFTLQELLELSRNPYDRIGHFAQGFVPAILVREILLRTSPLRPGRWLFFLVTSVCLAFSAFYELLEWWAALAGGEAADSFLGTQGDVWDTQWDMCLAMIGAITAQLLLTRRHDKEIATLPASAGAG